MILIFGPDGEMEIKNEIMRVEKLLVFCGSRFFYGPALFRAFSEIFLMMKKHSQKLQN
jgi:hypothetical protein